MTKNTPRNLDHVVLPIPDLKVARERLGQLGFTVAPDGKHKFGTENACVKFADGTFLEPLAIGQRETVEANIQKGNMFLRRDSAYRFRQGENGFSCVVFASDDVAGDRKKLKRAGYETGKLVTVKRTGVHARLCFAIDDRAPDFSIFMCQDMIEDQTQKGPLPVHANGANGISRIMLHEQLPEDFQYYLQTVSGQREVRSHSFGMEMKLPNVSLSVLNASGMKNYLGVTDLPTIRGMRAVAIDVVVENINVVTKLLDDRKIAHRKIGDRVIVDAVPGQGTIVCFVEA